MNTKSKKSSRRNIPPGQITADWTYIDQDSRNVYYTVTLHRRDMDNTYLTLTTGYVVARSIEHIGLTVEGLLAALANDIRAYERARGSLDAFALDYGLPIGSMEAKIAFFGSAINADKLMTFLGAAAYRKLIEES